MKKLKYLKSKTVCFNFLSTFLMLSLQPLEQFFPLLKDYLSPYTYVALSVAIATVNIYLRTRTNKPLADYCKDGKCEADKEA